MHPWIMTTSFKKILKRANLPDMTFHAATRHTAVTLLFDKGTPPKLVQELLGHATISITLDTYSHVLPGMGDQTAAAMLHSFLASVATMKPSRFRECTFSDSR